MLTVDLLAAQSAGLAGLDALDWRGTSALVGGALLALGVGVGAWSRSQPVLRVYGAEVVAAAGILLLCLGNGWLAANPAIGTAVAIPLLAGLALLLRRVVPLSAYAAAGLALLSWCYLLALGWERALETSTARGVVVRLPRLATGRRRGPRRRSRARSRPARAAAPCRCGGRVAAAGDPRQRPVHGGLSDPRPARLVCHPARPRPDQRLRTPDLGPRRSGVDDRRRPRHGVVPGREPLELGGLPRLRRRHSGREHAAGLRGQRSDLGLRRGRRGGRRSDGRSAATSPARAARARPRCLRCARARRARPRRGGRGLRARAAVVGRRAGSRARDRRGRGCRLGGAGSDRPGRRREPGHRLLRGADAVDSLRRAPALGVLGDRTGTRPAHGVRTPGARRQRSRRRDRRSDGRPGRRLRAGLLGPRPRGRPGERRARPGGVRRPGRGGRVPADASYALAGRPGGRRRDAGRLRGRPLRGCAGCSDGADRRRHRDRRHRRDQPGPARPRVARCCRARVRDRDQGGRGGPASPSSTPCRRPHCWSLPGSGD